jgi:hypothetical protein
MILFADEGIRHRMRARRAIVLCGERASYDASSPSCAAKTPEKTRRSTRSCSNRRVRDVLHAAPHHGLFDQDELLRSIDRQGLEQHGIGETEDCAVCADAKRQVSVAAVVNPGRRKRARVPWRRSCASCSSHRQTQTARVSSLTNAALPNFKRAKTSRLFWRYSAINVVLRLAGDVIANVLVKAVQYLSTAPHCLHSRNTIVVPPCIRLLDT